MAGRSDAVHRLGDSQPQPVWGPRDRRGCRHGARHTEPVALFEIPIRNHTEHGEAIYDPFAGSGTVLMAAERLGRCCYAMELVPEHVQRIIDRWEAFTGQTAIKVAGS